MSELGQPRTLRARARKIRSELAQIEEIRRRWLVPVDEPLVLIAQQARSGGTLLSQLLDAHPEIHAHPFELQIGFPDVNSWPQLSTGDGPEAWFEQLSERHVRRAYRSGYSKDRPAEKLGHTEVERFPFVFPPELQLELFRKIAEERSIEPPRDILDCYFTSYFNAWLDNHNLYTGPKRWVVGFRGRLAVPPNIDRFFTDYPDGRHVGIVRDPRGWMASAMAYRGPRETDRFEDRVELWNEHTSSLLAAKRKRADATFLLRFERLVADTETATRRLADWLGIDWLPVLTSPTFNQLPIRANSSFAVDRHGVLPHTQDHWKAALTAEQDAYIRDRTRAVADEVDAACDLA